MFAGAGNYQNATRNRLNAQGSWYGYPEANVVGRRARSRARASRRSPATPATPTTLQIAVGCFNGTVEHRCTVAARRRRSRHLLSGARRRAQRPDARRPPPSRPRPAGRRRAARLRRRHARRQRQRRHPPRRDRRPHAAAAGRRRRGLRRPARAPTPARPARSRLKQGVPEPQHETVRPTGWPPAGGRCWCASPTPAATSPSRARTWSTSSRRPTAARSTAAARPTAAR